METLESHTRHRSRRRQYAYNQPAKQPIYLNREKRFTNGRSKQTFTALPTSVRADLHTPNRQDQKAAGVDALVYAYLIPQ